MWYTQHSAMTNSFQCQWLVPSCLITSSITDSKIHQGSLWKSLYRKQRNKQTKTIIQQFRVRLRYLLWSQTKASNKKKFAHNQSTKGFNLPLQHLYFPMLVLLLKTTIIWQDAVQYSASKSTANDSFLDGNICAKRSEFGVKYLSVCCDSVLLLCWKQLQESQRSINNPWHENERNSNIWDGFAGT